ncbi:MAG TPA: SDR family oxidoreductase [Balneolaceae bacterium]
MGDEQHHSVVITGASRGIGRQIALAFAKETDYALLLIARTEEGLEKTKRLCRAEGDNKIEIIACDITNTQAVDAITLPDGFPSPKTIINNAGSFLLKPLEETTHEEFEEQIQANLYSAVHITNLFLKALKAKKSALIVNICSAGAVEGLKDSGAYSASKHALLGYTRSLRQELMETEIRVTAINLGQTQSTSWEGSSIKGDLLIDPDDIARLIVILTQLSPRTVVEEMLVKPQHGRVPPM